MKTLATKTIERQGNDCWLTDTFEIVLDDYEYILRHTSKYTGWQNGRDVHEVNLGSDILVTYSKLYEYIKTNIYAFELNHNWYEW
jgi:hypothetical protein